MPSLNDICTNSRMRLDNPRPQTPSFLQTFRITTSVVQAGFNKLANTGNAWAIGETEITTDSTNEDYLLPVAENFGKPLQVLTKDDSDPAHIEREIDFFELQNLNYDWSAPNNIASGMSAYGSPHTAQRIAFFRQNGQDQIYARIKPKPQQQATYRIIYSIGDWVSSAAVNDSPLLSNHHHLFEVKSAFKQLPYAKWYDNASENTAKRQELAQFLKAEIDDYEPDFLNYIRNLRSDKMTTRFAAYSFD